MKYQLNMNSLYLCVKDMERAVRFYEEFLGKKAEKQEDVFSVFRLGDFRYCLFQPDRVQESVVWGDSCLPSFETDSIGAVMEKVVQMGCPIVFPLRQIGDNMVFEFTDTEGNDIEVYSPVVKKSAESFCPCPKVKCKYHADCAACRKHHSKKDKPPYCQRGKEKNKHGKKQEEKQKKHEKKKGEEQDN